MLAALGPLGASSDENCVQNNLKGKSDRHHYRNIERNSAKNSERNSTRNRIMSIDENEEKNSNSNSNQSSISKCDSDKSDSSDKESVGVASSSAYCDPNDSRRSSIPPSNSIINSKDAYTPFLTLNPSVQRTDGDQISTFKRLSRNGEDLLQKFVGPGKCFCEKVLAKGTYCTCLKIFKLFLLFDIFFASQIISLDRIDMFIIDSTFFFI